jgi:molybdate-binding protein/DNA-binding HxlR family transcriptional regulator
MADLGYVEGRSIIIENRSTGGDITRGLALIDEFIARPVDVLLSPGPAAVRAIVKKTKIPVVAVALPAVQSDPDLFQSLARPGGSLTGFAAFGEEMSAKRIEMLREILPGLKKLGVMNNATDPTFSAWGAQTMQEARTAGIEPVRLGLTAASPAAVAEQIKVLADARRLKILRLLMAQPATLTQLAASLKESPAWVRHHIKALEAGGLVELAEVRTTGTVTEKFYRARSGALLLQEVILPRSRKPAVIFAGSHDLALEGLSATLAGRMTLLSIPVGSLDGLIHLRQGLCQVSGAHLLDAAGEYNAPFVRHLFPDRRMELVTLANRTQGLMLRAGNPKSMRGVADLGRQDIRFVNRNRGSGTRLWLDAELTRAGIEGQQVHGYALEVTTHSEAAALIEAGKADAALGLQAAADQHGLAFIPLFEERYDLVLSRENEKSLAPLLDHLQTADFRKQLKALGGYNPAHSGEQIQL